MGNRHSQPVEDAPLVFTNPHAPTGGRRVHAIQFTPDLLAHLDDSRPVRGTETYAPANTPTIAASSATSAQPAASVDSLHIQRLVDSEVRRQLALERTHRQANEHATSHQLLRETERVIAKIKDLPATTSDASPLSQMRKEKYTVASERVIECYAHNKSTPLDCWREVHEFKLLAAEAQQLFVDTLAKQ